MALDQNEVEQELQGFVSRDLLGGQDDGLDAATPLLELGLINSLSVVMLVAFVEKRFSVRIPDRALNREHLATIRAIAALVRTLAET